MIDEVTSVSKIQAKQNPPPSFLFPNTHVVWLTLPRLFWARGIKHQSPSGRLAFEGRVVLLNCCASLTYLSRIVIQM
jgi:hypothetical protein